MTMLLRTSQSRKAEILGALLLLVVLLSALFVVIRTTGYGPSSGDIAAWIFIHEWLVRGVPLYEGIWDHKDWGFFAVTNPFYRLAGITGLYFSAIVVVSAFIVGIFLTVIQIVSSRRAIVIAVFAGATYTAAPSYLSTYTENYAISLAVLALGLFFRYPVSSGAVFALSVSVKVSGISLFALILIADSALQFFSHKSSLIFVIRRAFRVLAGFGLAAIAIVAWAYAQSSLKGWADIIDYNLEYAAIRRELTPSVLTIIPFLKYAYPGEMVIFFLFALTTSLIAQFALCRISLRHQERLKLWSKNSLRAAVLSITLACGSLVALIAQFPPRYQHWQYFVGPAVALSAVLVAVLWQHSSAYSLRFRAVLVIVVLLPVAMGNALLIRTEGLGALATGLSRWVQLDEGGDPITALEGTSPNSSLVFIDASERLIRAQSIPDDAQLQCRFFYNFPHLLPRYGAEMLRCLETGADYVILRRDFDSDSHFNTDVLTILKANYKECKVADPVFQLWSGITSECPTAA